MRLEELSTDDLREIAPFCDTLLVTFGGLSWRPPHLPIGASWYILRRLRDSLEGALGGRILSLPVQGVDIPTDEGALASIPEDALRSLFERLLHSVGERVEFRFVVLLTDSLQKESLLTHAFSTYAGQGKQLLSFVWWRDGLRSYGASDQAADGEDGAPADSRIGNTFAPAGHVETSILLAVAKRLVDMEQKSATRNNAQGATASQGQGLLETAEQALRRSVEALWFAR